MRLGHAALTSSQFFILNVHDDRVLNHTLWCVSYLSNGNEEQVRAILDLGIADQIVLAMGHQEMTHKAPAIRAAGNLLTETDELSAVLVENGVIPALANTLDDPSRILKKEACWALSNLLVGKMQFLEQVFDYKDNFIIKKLFELIHSSETEVSYLLVLF